MKETYSGNIYQFELEFQKGICYGEILDYSDVSEFDGRLVQVYNLIDAERHRKREIEDIVNSGLMFGPAPVNKYPTARGKGRWKLIGKNSGYSTVPPVFKDLRAILSGNNWADLGPWFKQDRLDRRFESYRADYEDVRHLETVILNHPDSVVDKITMMAIIRENESVADYYDLTALGNRNIFVQVVNTYYEKSVAELLLQQIVEQ